MRCILSLTNDPCLNLAAEEFLLKEFPDDCMMIYRNEPSIIVGKHQNTLAEINTEFVNTNQIRVVRRLSGGGAVYHDLGNVNFCFIRNGEPGKLVDFIRFVQPVVDLLNNMDVPAVLGKHNDILVNGLKISGNAEHIYRNRTLHHGTLLFNSDLSKLELSLLTAPGQFIDRAVQSIRSKVINISEFLSTELPIESFTNLLYENLKSTFVASKHIPLNEAELSRIHTLADEKYRRWDWNYGYSPDFQLIRQATIDGISREITIKVSNGLITEVFIIPELLPDQQTQAFIKSITGLPLEKSALERSFWQTEDEKEKKLQLEISHAIFV